VTVWQCQLSLSDDSTQALVCAGSLSVFPVQKVAHCFSTGLIQFTTGVGLCLAGAVPCVLVFATRRAAIRKAWLAGSQLELLCADAANSNWKSHWNLRLRSSSMIFDEMTNTAFEPSLGINLELQIFEFLVRETELNQTTTSLACGRNNIAFLCPRLKLALDKVIFALAPVVDRVSPTREYPAVWCDRFGRAVQVDLAALSPDD